MGSAFLHGCSFIASTRKTTERVVCVINCVDAVPVTVADTAAVGLVLVHVVVVVEAAALVAVVRGGWRAGAVLAGGRWRERSDTRGATRTRQKQREKRFMRTPLL